MIYLYFCRLLLSATTAVLRVVLRALVTSRCLAVVIFFVFQLLVYDMICVSSNVNVDIYHRDVELEQLAMLVGDAGTQRQTRMGSEFVYHRGMCRHGHVCRDHKPEHTIACHRNNFAVRSCGGKSLPSWPQPLSLGGNARHSVPEKGRTCACFLMLSMLFPCQFCSFRC